MQHVEREHLNKVITDDNTVYKTVTDDNTLYKTVTDDNDRAFTAASARTRLSLPSLHFIYQDVTGSKCSTAVTTSCKMLLL